MAAHTDHRYYVLGGSKNGGAAAGESPGCVIDATANKDIFVGSGIDNKHRAMYCCAATRKQSLKEKFIFF
jgi:hypothetical protein